MEILLDSLRSEWENILRLAPRILLALLAVGMFVLLGRAAGSLLSRVLTRSRAPQAHRSFFRTVLQWLVTLVGVVVGLNILGFKGLATSLAAGGGVTAIIVGFAFRGIGENLLAGFSLVMGSTFKVGDFIRSGDFEGQVRGIELRHTHIRAADGRDIFIPSTQIYSNALVNFTKDGLRRLAFTLGVDYSHDTEEVRQVLHRAVRDTPGVLEEPASGVRVKDFPANYMELEVFFWVDTFKDPQAVGGVRNTVMERCRRVLLESGYIVSSEVSTNVNLAGKGPVDVTVGDPEKS